MSQSAGEVDGHRGLADTALAAGHRDNPAKTRDFALVRPWTLRSCGSSLLRLTRRHEHVHMDHFHSRKPAHDLLARFLDLPRRVRIWRCKLQRDAHRAITDR